MKKITFFSFLLLFTGFFIGSLTARFASNPTQRSLDLLRKKYSQENNLNKSSVNIGNYSSLIDRELTSWPDKLVKINQLSLHDPLLIPSLLAIGESWSNLDLISVVEKMKGIEDLGRKNILLRGYLKKFMRHNLEDAIKEFSNPVISNDLRNVCYAICSEMCIKHNPSRAVHYAAQNLSPAAIQQLGKALHEWVKLDYQAASDWISISPQNTRDDVIKGLLETFKLNSTRAIELIDKARIAPGKSLVAEIVKNAPLKDKEKTMAWLNTIEDPFVRNSGINRLIVGQAAKSKPEEVYQFLEQAPSVPVQTRIIESWVHAQETWNLEGILASTSQWSSPKVRKQAAEKIISRWHRQEPSKCSAWVKKSGDPVAAEALQTAIAAAQARAAKP